MNYVIVAENISAMEKQIQDALDHNHLAAEAYIRQLYNYLNTVLEAEALDRTRMVKP